MPVTSRTRKVWACQADGCTFTYYDPIGVSAVSCPNTHRSKAGRSFSSECEPIWDHKVDPGPPPEPPRG